MKDADAKFHSQYGEDKILFKLFKERQNGVCVEVGALDGITHSNSYFFEQIGWKCVLIEPIPELYETIKRERKGDNVFNVAASSQPGESTFYMADGLTLALSSLEKNKLPTDLIEEYGGKIKEIKVKLETLDNILEVANINSIDFISIDVEGHEIDVLRGFSISKYNPRIILIEDNSGLLENQIAKYMKKFGYVQFCRTGWSGNANDWYAKHTDSEIVDMSEVNKIKYQRIKASVKGRLKLIIKLVGRLFQK
jgi:FkbM family methyltransferase